MSRDQFDISTLPEIAATRLLPYRKNQRCPKCGNRERRGWLYLLFNRGNFLARAYCTGHNDTPTVEVPGPDGKMQEMRLLCAGVREEHMHLQCMICGFKFMCEVKERAR